MTGINGGSTVAAGFAQGAVLSVADTVIDAVKAGAIKHFFLVAGCDGARLGRSYYTDFAKATPDNAVVPTLLAFVSPNVFNVLVENCNIAPSRHPKPTSRSCWASRCFGVAVWEGSPKRPYFKMKWLRRVSMKPAFCMRDSSAER